MQHGRGIFDSRCLFVHGVQSHVVAVHFTMYCEIVFGDPHKRIGPMNDADELENPLVNVVVALNVCQFMAENDRKFPVGQMIYYGFV